MMLCSESGLGNEMAVSGRCGSPFYSFRVLIGVFR